MKDVEDIIAKCHELGLKILFDLICNHTSHLHPWFIESAKSKSTADNPFRKYYIWRPPRHDADGKRLPPTNLRAIFGGSAWHWSEETQEYYLGVFTPQQPDLNWEDEEVREAIYQEAILYWLEKGIDGFRVDSESRGGSDLQSLAALYVRSSPNIRRLVFSPLQLLPSTVNFLLKMRLSPTPPAMSSLLSRCTITDLGWTSFCAR